MSDAAQAVSAILLAIVGLAIVAVVVSKNANTSGVITGAGSAFSSIIAAAVAPVSNSGSAFGGSVGSAVSSLFG